MNGQKLYYSRTETAELLSISVTTLDRMRNDGTGPTVTLFGRRVMYQAGDIARWVRERHHG